ncbi:Methyl-coenzyme M reductase II subunit gamma like [Melia azedarach]|uniref:Methyl-coenzyme M reductase II subunit gamma like n=1 Tax=Melia azedarach TaxID=155640 RepID=A0ACC1WQG8_MELAZ|nr:Methyl-coenzyme M reductase II subunit gamma like [Melia azedarach]
MAMAGVGTAGPTLVEAYVMRAQYTDKMKQQQKVQAVDKSRTAGMIADGEKKIPGGCFFWLSKKNHSAKVSSAAD